MVANYNHGGYKMDDNEISVILMILATVQMPFLVSEGKGGRRGEKGKGRGEGERWRHHGDAHMYTGGVLLSRSLSIQESSGAVATGSHSDCPL